MMKEIGAVALVSLSFACSTVEPFSVDTYRSRLTIASGVTPGVHDSEICHPALDRNGGATEDWCVESGEAYRVQRTTPIAPPMGEFSLLAWSCVEPFSYEDGEPRPTVLARRALSMHTMALRAEGKLQVEGFPLRPSVGFALGDQIYVDPEPDSVGQDGASFAVFGGARSTAQYLQADQNPADFFQAAYEGYLLNGPMNQVLSVLPTMMIWDDHEIRDGWGSQRDERSDVWQRWFASAGQAYDAWQLGRGPLYARAGEPNPDRRRVGEMWSRPAPSDSGCKATPQRANIGALDVFAMDARTCRVTPRRRIHPRLQRQAAREGRKLAPQRPVEAASILGESQLGELETWLSVSPGNACTPGKIWTLASPGPLFVRASGGINVSHGFGRFFTRDELSDDLVDSWGHRSHREEQHRVISALEARLSHCSDEYLLVLSGDIHQSGLLGISIAGRMVGYEVISSGLAADVSGKDRFAWLGLEPYRAPRGALAVMRADWLGRTGTTPGFAEIRLIPGAHSSGETPPKLEVAWYVASDGNDLRNTGPFRTLACGRREERPQRCTLPAEHERLFQRRRKGREVGGDAIFVDDLALGVPLQTVLEEKRISERSWLSWHSVSGDLHPSSVFGGAGPAANTRVSDLSACALCEALGEPIVLADCAAEPAANARTSDLSAAALCEELGDPIVPADSAR